MIWNQKGQMKSEIKWINIWKKSITNELNFLIRHLNKWNINNNKIFFLKISCKGKIPDFSLIWNTTNKKETNMKLKWLKQL